MSKNNRTLADIHEENKTNCTFDDFPIGTKVKVMTPCQDFHFFYGETGEVIKNTGGYLGITIKFDELRHYEDGTILETFGFKPEDLKPIRKGYLLGEEVNEAIQSVYSYMDTLNLMPYIKEFKGEDIHVMMDKLEDNFPFKDDYSECLFDVIDAEEFADYLNKRYDLKIRETTITNFYI